MKKITRHIPARTSTVYQCDKCKTKYQSEKRALKCNAMPVENKFFKLGDSVTWNGWWHCKPKDKTYRFVGRVLNITGPVAVDYDYDHVWLNGKIFGKHIYQYEVQWDCRKCRDVHEFLFYSCQLKKNKTR